MVQRMSRSLRFFAIFVMVPALIAMLNACAPWKPAPQRLGGSNFTVDVPKGWMRLSTPEYDMLSKDGPYLQYILIQALPVNHRFRFTRRKLTSRMLPHEAAQVVVANLTSDPQLKNFTLISNDPVALGHALGFKLVYAYTDSYGVDLQSIYLGAISGDVYIHLRYTAAKRHYFSKDLSDFEHIHRSLRIIPAS